MVKIKNWTETHLHRKVADEGSFWKKHGKGGMLAKAQILIDQLCLHRGPTVPQLDDGRSVVSGHLDRLRNSPRRRKITLLLNRRAACCTCSTARTCGCAGGVYSHWRGEFLFVFACKECSQEREQVADMAVAILIWSECKYKFSWNFYLSLKLGQQIGQFMLWTMKNVNVSNLKPKQNREAITSVK